DMTYDCCRALWPEKAFWGNLNLGLYDLPPQALRQAVLDKQRRAGKCTLAFEISEDLPGNWRATIPIVLDALAESP
ncbi:MAG: hypothetical protein NT154_48830, partial [Verrucomicrobia bacterium]|nr:hypothetical protein [Verrucomicrobiota bacterium]